VLNGVAAFSAARETAWADRWKHFCSSLLGETIVPANTTLGANRIVVCDLECSYHYDAGHAKSIAPVDSDISRWNSLITPNEEP
jgi:hypothetical protein